MLHAAQTMRPAAMSFALGLQVYFEFSFVSSRRKASHVSHKRLESICCMNECCAAENQTETFVAFLQLLQILTISDQMLVGKTSVEIFRQLENEQLNKC